MIFSSYKMTCGYYNISKCFLLHLGPPHKYGEYNIQDTIISSSDTINDLGVLIHDNLKFHSHATSAISKAIHTLATVLFRRPFISHVCYSLQVFGKTSD